jgi:hypothetical protein
MDVIRRSHADKASGSKFGCVLAIEILETGMTFHSTIESPRGAKRTRVLLKGVLMTVSGAQKVTVRDISRTGVHVVGVRGLREESDAVFSRGDLFAAARVAWVDGDEAGIRFYRDLSPEEIDGSLPTALLHEKRSARP